MSQNGFDNDSSPLLGAPSEESPYRAVVEMLLSDWAVVSLAFRDVRSPKDRSDILPAALGSGILFGESDCTEPPLDGISGRVE